MEPQRKPVEHRYRGELLDSFETPLAFAQLDGTVDLANVAFRSWTASTADDLASVLGIEVHVVAAALRTGKPYVVKGSAKNARGREIPVEYLLRLVLHDGREAIAIEGRDLSRVHEKEAMLQSFSSLIEVNNRRLTAQTAQITTLLDNVNAAYAATQRLLDSTDQGFVTLDRSGNLMAARSTIFDRWFDSPAPGTSFASCVRRLDPDAGARFELAWWQIEDGFLPLALLLEQLPSESRMNGRYLRIRYKPEFESAERLANLLVVISDVTDEVERQRTEAQHHDLRSLLTRYSKDRDGFVEFVTEADALISAVTAESADPLDVMRAVHTLKGTCGVFGAQTMASICHEFESRAAELMTLPNGDERRRLGDAWHALRERISTFLAFDDDVVALTRTELETLCRRVSMMPPDELAHVLETWMWESAAKRLARLGEQARALAARLGNGPLAVEVDGAGLRFNPELWNPFWASLIHVIRNSVQHGLEPPETRLALGKLECARLTLRTYIAGTDVVIELGDDGRGIDWAAVARAASERGLDVGSRAALEQALFLDGFSTRTTVDEQSGRGIGLAAVRAACDRLGGAIGVVSDPGHGALLRFRLPARGVAVC
jgi:two-component system, chemotaxis family, sensor kinase CheA